MKNILLILLLNITLLASSQVVYDFSNNPTTNGWTYYDNYSSNPTAAFTYDATNERIQYSFNIGVEIALLHRALPSQLANNYCVSLKITPTNSNNYNSWFPLILTPSEQLGTHLHPHRQNAINPTTAGPFQNLDFLAIEISDDQLRLCYRDNNNSNTYLPMTPAFNLNINYAYWIKLEVINSTSVELSVYQDENFNTLLATTSYSIPALESMNHLYIANNNGNSTSTHNGYLDDYKIDICSSLDLPILYSNKKEVVKIIDFMGRETKFQSNTPLIYIYNDGSTERIMKIKE